jgi:transcriptional regulator with XRE-family HTH domain
MPKTSKPSPPSRTLGRNIHDTRKAWGISQQALATALRCDQASVSFWERDVVVPSGAALTALSCLIGISVEQLLDVDAFVVPAGPADIPAFHHLFAERALGKVG